MSHRAAQPDRVLFHQPLLPMRCAKTPLRLVPALFVLLCIVPACAPAQEADDAVMFRGDPAHHGTAEGPALASYGGVLWRAGLPGPIRSTAAVAGATVYVGSARGFLHALDAVTGEERWRYDAGAAVHGSPAALGDVVYVTDLQSTLHAVDAGDGSRVWTLATGETLPFPWGHESGDTWNSSPVIATAADGAMIYFGAGDGGLYAVDARGGDVAWRLQTEGRIRSTPAVSEDRVVVGGSDGVVYAADAATGELLWRHETEGASLRSEEFGFDRRTIQSSPAIADGRVHIGTRDGNIYTLDLATGRRLWTASHVSSWINGSPAVAGGRVFAGSSDAQFVQALDAASGEEIWRRESAGIVWTSPLVVDDLVVFAEGAGRVRALDAATGEDRWSVWLGGRLFASPVVSEGVLYIGTEAGGLYALRDGGEEPLLLAVAWDSAFASGRWYLDHEELAEYLVEGGYELLDGPATEAWLQARVRDGVPSAIVFAIDYVPAAIAGPDGALRRYLDAGGTVVWPGYPPDLWRRDLQTGESGGLIAVDRARTAALVDVDHRVSNFDPMGAWPTQEGRRMGLPETFLSRWDVAPQEGLEPLAIDERGHYASWRKRFGGPPGTGFVRIWGGRRTPADPSVFATAAEWRPYDPARDGDVRRRAAIDSFVREAMAEIGAVPGLAVSVVRADSVLFEGTWGLRDAAGGLPVTPATGFYIASSTKSYVALLTVLLDRAGVLDLDEPLTSCLPGLELNDTVDPDAITIRDLLRHTIGWEDDAINVRTAYIGAMTPAEMRAHVASFATREDDGHFAYDNIGFVMDGLCLRERTGDGWKRLLETRVLAPLGLRSTTAYVSEAAGTGDFALPHLWDGLRHRPIPPKTDEIMHAAGGLVTSVEDAGRWIRILLGGGMLDGERLVPAGAIEEVLRRQVDADTAQSFWEFSRLGYGLGWFDGAYRGDRLVHHFGGYPGAQAHISLMPARDVGVAALVNGGGAGGYLLPHIVAAYAYDLLAGRPDALERARAAVRGAAAEAREAASERAEVWRTLDRLRADPPAPAHALGRYVGRYAHPRYEHIDVVAAPGGRLWVDWGARHGDLLPEAGNVFLADWEPGVTPDRLTFRVLGDGPAAAFTWRGLEFRREPAGGDSS